MSEPWLQHGEWTLITPDGEVTFGTVEHFVWNRTTPSFGDTDIRTSDVDRRAADGRGFGEDWRGGQTIGFDLVAYHPEPGAVRDVVDTMKRLWRGDAVRSTPGSVAELRFAYDGRERSVFGRPRKWAPDYQHATTGSMIPILADFACVDDLYYGAEESMTVTLAGSAGGGLIAPLVAPLATTTTSDRSSVMTVTGEAATWPVLTIHGPVVNPTVIVDDLRLDLRLTLLYDQEVVIDPRPWARTVLRDGLSVAGALRGTRLAAFRLEPGAHEFTIRGTDPTGTASATVAWRAAHVAP